MIEIIGALIFFILGILFWILRSRKHKKLFEILFHLGTIYLRAAGPVKFTYEIERDYEKGIYTKIFTIVSIFFFILGFLFVLSFILQL